VAVCDVVISFAGPTGPLFGLSLKRSGVFGLRRHLGYPQTAVIVKSETHDPFPFNKVSALRSFQILPLPSFLDKAVPDV